MNLLPKPLAWQSRAPRRWPDWRQFLTQEEAIELLTIEAQRGVLDKHRRALAAQRVRLQNRAIQRCKARARDQGRTCDF